MFGAVLYGCIGGVLCSRHGEYPGVRFWVIVGGC